MLKRSLQIWPNLHTHSRPCMHYASPMCICPNPYVAEEVWGGPAHTQKQTACGCARPHTHTSLCPLVFAHEHTHNIQVTSTNWASNPFQSQGETYVEDRRRLRANDTVSVTSSVKSGEETTSGALQNGSTVAGLIVGGLKIANLTCKQRDPHKRTEHERLETALA